jgi:hypothetical protein
MATLGVLAVHRSQVPAPWSTSTLILSAPYVDTPYLVSMPGVLGCVVTTNASGGEGSEGEHVAILRSTDNGVTWGNPIEVEPVANPSSSWGCPYYDAANDLLYVFYTYNTADVTTVGASSRVDCVGVLAYRTSSDKGLTWSSRTELAIPTTSIDTANITSGTHKLFWLFDVPKFKDGYVYIGLSKITNMSFTTTQSFFAKVAIPPSGITLLPSGSAGVSANSTFGSTTICEEPTCLLHSDGLITMIARTAVGRLVEAYSTDGGATFTVDWAMQTDGSTYILNPRGPASAWELPDGRFFLWHYDNTGSTFNSQRNPVWYRLGERSGNRVRWGAQRYMLTSDAHSATPLGMSYASMVVVGTELIFAAADKGTAHDGIGARLFRCDISEIG